MDPSKEQVLSQDEAILHQLGYKQVLYRSWGAFTAITITISAMSVLTSISGALRHRWDTACNLPRSGTAKSAITS